MLSAFDDKYKNNKISPSSAGKSDSCHCQVAFLCSSYFMAASEFYVRIFLVKTRCKEEECATWARLCPRERGRGRGGAGERRPRGTLRLHHSPGGGAPRLFSPLCSLVTLASLPLVVYFDGHSPFIPSLSLKTMNPSRRE